jgi:hypothetical protein
MQMHHPRPAAAVPNANRQALRLLRQVGSHAAGAALGHELSKGVRNPAAKVAIVAGSSIVGRLLVDWLSEVL